MSLRVDLTANALQNLQRFVAAFDDQNAALHVIGRVLTTQVQMGFRTSTNPWGVPWHPLLIRKGKPLVDTGRLKNSITSNVEGDHVLIGTKVDYAPIQQFGGVIKPKNAQSLRFYGGGGLPIFAREVRIPARPFLPILPSGAANLPLAWENATLLALQRHYESKIR